MAVGAVDNTLDIAFFSARSSELEGGQVDIAGPGVDFSAAEVAAQLDTTVASVNSALQRARNSLDQRVPEESQQATLRALGAEGRRELVDAFVAEWERAMSPRSSACSSRTPGSRCRRCRRGSTVWTTSASS